MSKILRVIEPFIGADVDDTFVLSDDSKYYVAERNEEFRTAKDSGEIASIFNSTFKISPEWAKQLVEDGFLVEVEDSKQKASFVNVFDEIENLLKKYTYELHNLQKDMADAPECLKVERTTVLINIVNVLNHLKALRK